jgi:hypothetical protein
METWFRAKNYNMDLERVRLAFDKEDKHTFSVKDSGVNKEKAEHLYKGVEYRIELDDKIRLSIDGKSSRKINWRAQFRDEEIRALYDYAIGEAWLDGWGPVAEIVETNDG